MPVNRPRPLNFSLALAALLVVAPTAYAQPPIEQQMTPEQFKASGLEKLSPQELANLNAWLNNTLEVETTKAATIAKEKVETENRGFAPGRSWTLDNGQVWEQFDSASLAGARKTDPQVRITPAVIGNKWYMQVEGYNTRAGVRRVK